MWYHEEEKNSVGILLKYGMEHVHEPITLHFGKNESYICDFLSSYESDNIAEVENHDAEYDEFIVVAYRVLKVVQAGSHYSIGDGGIEITYLNMPDKVTNSRGEIIYPLA